MRKTRAYLKGKPNLKKKKKNSEEKNSGSHMHKEGQRCAKKRKKSFMNREVAQKTWNRRLKFQSGYYSVFTSLANFCCRFSPYQVFFPGLAPLFCEDKLVYDVKTIQCYLYRAKQNAGQVSVSLKKKHLILASLKLIGVEKSYGTIFYKKETEEKKFKKFQKNKQTSTP